MSVAEVLAYRAELAPKTKRDRKRVRARLDSPEVERAVGLFAMRVLRRCLVVQGQHARPMADGGGFYFATSTIAGWFSRDGSVVTSATPVHVARSSVKQIEHAFARLRRFGLLIDIGWQSRTDRNGKPRPKYVRTFADIDPTTGMIPTSTEAVERASAGRRGGRRPGAGRHKGSCECPKCIARKASAEFKAGGTCDSKPGKARTKPQAGTNARNVASEHANRSAAGIQSRGHNQTTETSGDKGPKGLTRCARPSLLEITNPSAFDIEAEIANRQSPDLFCWVCLEDHDPDGECPHETHGSWSVPTSATVVPLTSSEARAPGAARRDPERTASTATNADAIAASCKHRDPSVSGAQIAHSSATSPTARSSAVDSARCSSPPTEGHEPDGPAVERNRPALLVSGPSSTLPSPSPSDASQGRLRRSRFRPR